jgi:hypothetical protein
MYAAERSSKGPCNTDKQEAAATHQTLWPACSLAARVTAPCKQCPAGAGVTNRQAKQSSTPPNPWKHSYNCQIFRITAHFRHRHGYTHPLQQCCQCAGANCCQCLSRYHGLAMLRLYQTALAPLRTPNHERKQQSLKTPKRMHKLDIRNFARTHTVSCLTLTPCSSAASVQVPTVASASPATTA